MTAGSASDGEPEPAKPDAEAASFTGGDPWGEDTSYWHTRMVFLRGLGFIYCVAFGLLFRQVDGLLGSRGLLPVEWFLRDVREFLGAAAYVRLPTLLFLGSSDVALKGLCLLGLAFSIAAVLGYASALIFGGLWLVYMSFVHAGQIFYGYGWELLLLEAGFLAMFFAPPWSPKLYGTSPPPRALPWLLRWLLFRVMFGAGLIKVRGDPCWLELTCLADHYETQPNPSPLSYYFHAMPMWFHKAGTLFNHVVELVVPFGLFGPRRVRHVAGGLVVVFQMILIVSGNLSFLNWLTIVVAVSAFDDSFLARILPARLVEAAKVAATGAVESVRRRTTIVLLAVLIALLSIVPTVNLISPDQKMNASFDPFDLVNTYGAFGNVDHERHEVVLEGTWDDVLSGDAQWLEYEFPCKPGDRRRAPCLVTPYHYRLDWQMWFAGHAERAHDSWFFRLVYDLLRENRAVTALLAKDPFEGRPPRYVRALLYHYSFAHGERGVWWNRALLGEYLRPVALDDPALLEVLRRRRLIRK
jgi:hypothetical protein